MAAVLVEFLHRLLAWRGGHYREFVLVCSSEKQTLLFMFFVMLGVFLGWGVSAPWGGTPWFPDTLRDDLLTFRGIWDSIIEYVWSPFLDFLQLFVVVFTTRFRIACLTDVVSILE